MVQGGEVAVYSFKVLLLIANLTWSPFHGLGLSDCDLLDAICDIVA